MLHYICQFSPSSFISVGWCKEYIVVAICEIVRIGSNTFESLGKMLTSECGVFILNLTMPKCYSPLAKPIKRAYFANNAGGMHRNVELFSLQATWIKIAITQVRYVSEDQSNFLYTNEAHFVWIQERWRFLAEPIMCNSTARKKSWHRCQAEAEPRASATGVKSPHRL